MFCTRGVFRRKCHGCRNCNRKSKPRKNPLEEAQYLLLAYYGDGVTIQENKQNYLIKYWNKDKNHWVFNSIGNEFGKQGRFTKKETISWGLVKYTECALYFFSSPVYPKLEYIIWKIKENLKSQKPLKYAQYLLTEYYGERITIEEKEGQEYAITFSNEKKNHWVFNSIRDEFGGRIGYFTKKVKSIQPYTNLYTCTLCFSSSQSSPWLKYIIEAIEKKLEPIYVLKKAQSLLSEYYGGNINIEQDNQEYIITYSNKDKNHWVFKHIEKHLRLLGAYNKIPEHIPDTFPARYIHECTLRFSSSPDSPRLEHVIKSLKTPK